MQKRYCEELDMAKSIYGNNLHGELVARVVIRDRLDDNDLNDVRRLARLKAEEAHKARERKEVRAALMRLYYKRGQDYFSRAYSVEMYDMIHDPDKRIRFTLSSLLRLVTTKEEADGMET